MINKVIKTILNEGLITIPEEIYSWINNNIEKLYKLLKTKPLSEKLLFDSFSFINPYFKNQDPQPIDIWIIRDTKNVKDGEASFYVSTEKGMFINSEYNFVNIDQLYDILVHEFVHAVDPKNNKDQELRLKSNDYKDIINDKHRSAIEIDAYTKSIITTLKRLLPNKELEEKLKDFIKNDQEFPLLPQGYHAYQKFVDKISIDKKILTRFKEKLAKFLF